MLTSLQESLVALSAMADMKANIMMTICSILLTLALSRIEQGILLGPTIAFAIFCVPALFFSILTVMPSPASSAKPVSRHGKTHHFNPLFFMHFSRVSLEEFKQEMDRMVRDPQELYKDIAHDVYYAGLVLRIKKYRYLRWSYMAFLVGVVCGGLVLVLGVASGGRLFG